MRKITEFMFVQWFNLFIIIVVMIYPYVQIWRQKNLFNETIEKLESFPADQLNACADIQSYFNKQDLLNAVNENKRMTQVLWWLLTVQYLFIFVGPVMTLCTFYGL